MVFIGEINSFDEEVVVKYLQEIILKSVIDFIFGEAVWEWKVMGHASAIISPGGEGGFRYKRKVPQEAVIHMIEKLSEIAGLVSEIL